MSYVPQNAKSGQAPISVIPDIITLLLYSATAVSCLYLVHSSYLLVYRSKTSFSLSSKTEPTYPRFIGTWLMDYKTVKGSRTTFFVDSIKCTEGGFASNYLGDDWVGYWRLSKNQKGKKVLTIYEYQVPKNNLDAPNLFWTYSVILDKDELGGVIIGTGGERIQLHRK